MTIEEFIRARLDEDEAIARECDALYFHPVKRATGLVDIEAHYHPVEEYRHFLWFTHRHPGFPPPYAQHIARHDPAHVLKQVECQREILRLCLFAMESDKETNSYTPEPRQILAALAKVWSDHADYQSDWARFA